MFVQDLSNFHYSSENCLYSSFRLSSSSTNSISIHEICFVSSWRKFSSCIAQTEHKFLNTFSSVWVGFGLYGRESGEKFSVRQETFLANWKFWNSRRRSSLNNWQSLMCHKAQTGAKGSAGFCTMVENYFALFHGGWQYKE